MKIHEICFSPTGGTRRVAEILSQALANEIVRVDLTARDVDFGSVTLGKDDVAMIWIDAHPDITLPGDVYPAYHAMAVMACMGIGNSQIISVLPAKIDPSKILLVGLRDWERDEIKKRQKQYGIRHLTPDNVRENSHAIKNWLRSCGASKVVIHFDMDVLDPAEIIAAVGVVPNGMKIAEVVRVINDIAQEKEIVGLTIAEPMPRTAILLKEMLAQLPMLK